MASVTFDRLGPTFGGGHAEVTKLTGVLVAPIVDPPEKYADCLVEILAQLGTVEIKWEDYQPRDYVKLIHVIEIKLPGDRLFAIRVV